MGTGKDILYDKELSQFEYGANKHACDNWQGHAPFIVKCHRHWRHETDFNEINFVSFQYDFKFMGPRGFQNFNTPKLYIFGSLRS